MRRKQAGFTLIELMIVIGIIGLLFAVLAPQFTGVQDEAYALTDGKQLQDHYLWLDRYKSKQKSLPPTGGCKFVLATWTAKLYEHTPENYAKFFTPGPASLSDPIVREGRDMLLLGEDPIPDLRGATSEYTHYVGRARAHLRTALMGEAEAWMANDNENGIPSLRDGTVNVLLSGGKVRNYSYQELQRLYDVPDLDKMNAILTYGPDSPIPECRKLDN